MLWHPSRFCHSGRGLWPGPINVISQSKGMDHISVLSNGEERLYETDPRGRSRYRVPLRSRS